MHYEYAATFRDALDDDLPTVRAMAAATLVNMAMQHERDRRQFDAGYSTYNPRQKLPDAEAIENGRRALELMENMVHSTDTTERETGLAALQQCGDYSATFDLRYELAMSPGTVCPHLINSSDFTEGRLGQADLRAFLESEDQGLVRLGLNILRTRNLGYADQCVDLVLDIAVNGDASLTDTAVHLLDFLSPLKREHLPPVLEMVQSDDPRRVYNGLLVLRWCKFSGADVDALPVLEELAKDPPVLEGTPVDIEGLVNAEIHDLKILVRQAEGAANPSG